MKGICRVSASEIFVYLWVINEDLIIFVPICVVDWPQQKEMKWRCANATKRRMCISFQMWCLTRHKKTKYQVWAKFDVHSHKCVCVLFNIWNALVIFCYKYNTLSYIHPCVLCLVCTERTMWNETRIDTYTNRVGHAQSKAEQLNRVWILSIQRHIFFLFISFARRLPVISLLSLSTLNFGFYFRFHRLFRFRNDFRWCLWTLLFWYLNEIIDWQM